MTERVDLTAVAEEVLNALQEVGPGIFRNLRASYVDELRAHVEKVLVLQFRGHTVGARPDGAAGVRVQRMRLSGALAGTFAEAGEQLHELACSARWTLPETVQAVAIPPGCGVPALGRIERDVLGGMAVQGPYLWIPDPDDGTRTELQRALRGRPSVAGPVVALADAANSLRWARRLLELLPGVTSELGMLHVEDHLPNLMLLQDESLARTLADRWLHPLSGLTPRQIERLEKTLLAWLESGGAPEAAKLLDVHPQTIRYRLRQLERLFGPALRDPQSRFELELALRSRHLIHLLQHSRSRTERRMRRAEGVGSVWHAQRVNGL
ncbi:helix-turn-helix domain-containing protein [Streptomyces sp. NPDC058989]|uniref:PucR family transcriptional regulator n=1 Tax=Streptomyces sp. NPDC058989 TaxID=3346686 RepID=UPI0036C9C0C3